MLILKFRVAIIGVAEREFNGAGDGSPGAAILDVIDVARQIMTAREEADIVLVTIHGGNEYFPYPRPGLRKICQYLVQVGADGVICHHPHVPGAFEYYQGKPIVYSLGNLLFDNSSPAPGWDEGYAVRISYRRDGQSVSFEGMEVIPYQQSVEIGGVRKLHGKRKDSFLEKIHAYNNKLKNTDEWMAEWRDYCSQKRLSVIAKQYISISFRGLSRILRLIPLERLFLFRKNIHKKLNMIRCDSHRELLVNILEMENDRHSSQIR